MRRCQACGKRMPRGALALWCSVACAWKAGPFCDCTDPDCPTRRSSPIGLRFTPEPTIHGTVPEPSPVVLAHQIKPFKKLAPARLEFSINVQVEGPSEEAIAAGLDRPGALEGVARWLARAVRERIARERQST